VSAELSLAPGRASAKTKEEAMTKESDVKNELFDNRVRETPAAYVRTDTLLARTPHPIGAQIAECQKAARKMLKAHIRKKYIYIDQAVSGASLGRPGLGALLEEVRSGRAAFDWLFIYDVARLSRDVSQFHLLVKELLNRGIRIHVVSSDIDIDKDNAMGIMGVMSLGL
jgi:DNA invertase Pin-like site-specific DNA recombinase